MAKQTDQDELNSILGMSDEDLMKMDPSQIEQMSQSQEEVVEEEIKDEAADEAVAESADAESGDEKDSEDEDKSDTANAEQTDESKEDTSEDLSDGDNTKSKHKSAEADPDKKVTDSADKKVDQADKDQIDYKAAYERILTPFKANGRDIAVKSVDDAIALMQMGANYSKKMAALKPNLKLLKLLENNGLLSEERIGFLIDLEKKNPEAINKLVKDSGLDPMEIDTEKAGDYKPNTYSVDDKEMELDSVLEEIQDSPTYTRTLEIVSKKWDGASKQVIAGSPQLLKVINDHVQSGIYDLISKEIENERVFGRLNGLSDIEAYRQVGDSIQARGGFAHLGRQGQQTPDKPVVVTPKPKVDEAKLRDKKRAASSTKPAAPSSQNLKDFNPLSLSDEEFSKVASLKY